MRYVCTVCGYVYDGAAGIPEDKIPPGTGFDALPGDWACPVCGAAKEAFEKEGGEEAAMEKEQRPVIKERSDMRELTFAELGALCSNLAKGCEKQYRPKEAARFNELAAYFRAAAEPAENPDFEDLQKLIENDLGEGFPAANAAAAKASDRGALRALVWSEKVTRIQRSILSRYQKTGDRLFENTSVYVCTICGFVYIGDALPEVCPVCKVPNWKFEKTEGRRN